MLGKPPIHRLAFLIGKLTMVACYTLALIQATGLRTWARSREVLQPVVLVLAIVGVIVLVASSAWLGSALRVGLPTSDTTLRTTGFYRFSRHPIYLSMLLLYLAACLYAPHPLVIACAVIAAGIHHRIALAEEAFLEQRFGEAWRAYRSRVPRYLGLPRKE